MDDRGVAPALRLFSAVLRLSLLSPFGRDGRAGASEGKGVGLGEGEGEESLRAVGACGCYNPSPQSSPLIQGYVFSANGAAIIGSLGQRPRESNHIVNQR